MSAHEVTHQHREGGAATSPEPISVHGGDRLLRETEVAQLAGVTRYALRSWRHGSQERGPRWVNVGTADRAAIRYRASDVQTWITGLTVDPEAA